MKICDVYKSYILSRLIVAFLNPCNVFASVFCKSHPTILTSSRDACRRHNNYTVLSCYGEIDVLHILQNQTNNENLASLIFCHWERPIDLNPHLLTHFLSSNITRLVFEYGNLTTFSKDFPKIINLQIINISWTSLNYLRSGTFRRLLGLRVLDLRWNQLIILNGAFQIANTFQKLFLEGNPWNCAENLEWLMLPKQIKLVEDRSKLTCGDQTFKDRHLIVVVGYRMSIQSTCMSHEDLINCSCFMHHIVPTTQTPLYTVDCSRLHLTHLPAFLPENTTTVYLTDNDITDLTPLRDNPHYHNVDDIHLDKNYIDNIDLLEGGTWLERFRLLNLQHNLLKKIPLYALDNALEYNSNANRLLLSQNPWVCTCKFTLQFREFLIKYNAILNDVSNITCSIPNHSNIPAVKILTISRDDVCYVSKGSTVYIMDFVNGLLGALIICILGSLVYDYYHYRKYGRVPWIVMKLPKRSSLI